MNTRNPRSKESVMNTRRHLVFIAALALLINPAGSQQVISAPVKQLEIQVPDTFTLERDIEYGRAGDHILKLDMARPKEPKRKPLPLIVYIHGGGWMGGDKSEAWRGARLGQAPYSGDYAVVSIDYRLTGVAPWPACIHDCKTAIRWLRANARKFDFDPERIAVWGHSAGGHLAALLATTGDVRELEGDGGHGDQSSRVTCGIVSAGSTDFAAIMDYKRPVTASYRWLSPNDPKGPERRLFNGPLPERLQEMKAASPTTYAAKTSAPLLIWHGSEDTVVPISQAELLHEVLEKAGAEVIYVRINGGGHAAGHPELTKRRTLFLEKYLLGKKDIEISGGTFEMKK